MTEFGVLWNGISNDAYYDQGKIWITESMRGSDINSGGLTRFKEVDISDSGWNTGKETKVSDSGFSCDIHIYYPMTNTLPRISTGSVATPQVKVTVTVTGLQLIFKSQELMKENYVELFNLKGEKVACEKLTDFSQNILLINKIPNGRYILNFNNNKLAYNVQLHL